MNHQWFITVCECGRQVVNEWGYDGEYEYCPAEQARYPQRSAGHQEWREVEVVEAPSVEDDECANHRGDGGARGEAVKTECATCHGDGEITFNPGYPDPQTEDNAPCPDCHGTGEIEQENP